MPKNLPILWLCCLALFIQPLCLSRPGSQPLYKKKVIKKKSKEQIYHVNKSRSRNYNAQKKRNARALQAITVTDTEKIVPRTKHEHLTQALNKVVQPADNKAAVGIKIISLKNDKCLYKKNEDQLFIPASNTKLITSAAALDILGPSYRFETQLAAVKQMGNAIGNLYIKGGGDPSLETKHLENMVINLKDHGIKEIRGNIIVDTSIFDDLSKGPGWTKDGPIFDKSPLKGLMLNHCCITVTIKPARIPGYKPSVFLTPSVPSMRIDNKARTVLALKKRSLHASRSPLSEKKISITGTISTKNKPKSYLIVLDNPHLYAAEVMQCLLKKHGIRFKGTLIVGKTPEHAKVLASHHSQPVSSLIRTVLKDSDNLYADALFKAMGMVTFHEQGTWETGKKAVDSFVSKEVGIVLSKLNLYDGSGLSHANRISPQSLAQFLSWVYSQCPYRDMFIDSLPISGIDGTLRNRMRHKDVQAKVKAKTGNLPGITSLAGYVFLSHDDIIIFAILVNRKKRSAVEFKRKLEDPICLLLSKQGAIS